MRSPSRTTTGRTEARGTAALRLEVRGRHLAAALLIGVLVSLGLEKPPAAPR